jgi:hypothetical protein
MYHEAEATNLGFRFNMSMLVTDILPFRSRIFFNYCMLYCQGWKWFKRWYRDGELWILTKCVKVSTKKLCQFDSYPLGRKFVSITVHKRPGPLNRFSYNKRIKESSFTNKVQISLKSFTELIL